MPRARSPDSIKAEKMYKEGMPLIEIAKKLKKPPGTVRRWKSEQRWDEDESERSETKASVRKQNSTVRSKAIAEEVDQVIHNPDLSDKQRLFCLVYVDRFNATKAYQKAYGCDYYTAKSQGYKLLRKLAIKAEIDRLKQAKFNRAMLKEEDIFQKYMDIAFSDITDYISFGNEIIDIVTKSGDEKEIEVNYVHLKPSDEIDGSLISEVTQGKDGVKIKLPDRMKALDWLAAHMDMATKEQEARIRHIKAQTEVLQESKAEGTNTVDDWIAAVRGEVPEEEIQEQEMTREGDNK